MFRTGMIVLVTLLLCGCGGTRWALVPGRDFEADQNHCQYEARKAAGPARSSGLYTDWSAITWHAHINELYRLCMINLGYREVK